MNTSLAVPNDGSWPLGQYDPHAQLGRGQRNYSATNILDFGTVLQIAFHWRWFILGAIVLGIAGAVLATLVTTPIYRAWVTLEANPPTFAVSDEQSREAEATAGNFDFVATQVGLIRSRSVAERTAQDLNLANNATLVPQDLESSERLRLAADTIADNLQVISPDTGQLIKFSYDSTSPQLAASIANGVADSFISSAIQRRYESSAYARNFLERQINKTRADLERSERSLVGYAQAEGIINTSGGNSNDKSGGSEAGSLEGASLVQLNAALAEATARRVQAEGAYREALKTGPTLEAITSAPLLRQQLATLEAEFQEKRTFLKPDHPDMVSLRSQINELRRQIAGESAQVSTARNNGLLADYRAALAAEQSLKGKVNQLKGSVLDLRGRSIKYTILQREVDTNRALYDALLQRYKEIGVAGGVGTAPVSIVDRATAPNLPFKPNLLFNLLIGVGLGFGLGIAGAVGLEFANDTIKTREDVRKKLSLPCLGLVPRAPAKVSISDDLRDPSSVISEAYSAVVAALRFSTEDGMPKVLVLCSTKPAEGKSSSALGIAQNFGRRGKSVLLIDADLRKPAFKWANDKIGLSKLLTTDESVRDHAVETQYSNLWLLPSGPVPPNPADLLATGRMRKILSEASESFELVVIDGPPTLGLADAPLLASIAGNVLFVIESAQTRTRAAVEALNRLEATGTRVLGAILTKSKETSSRYGYESYGYGYGYGHGKVKHTDIVMLPQDEQAIVEPEAGESRA